MITLDELDTLWNYSDPAGTEAAFRAHLPAAREAGGPLLVELLSQIARTYSLRGDFEPAHALLDEAEGLLAEGMDRARARVLMERGRCFNSAREPARAVPLFEAALASAEAAGADFYAVDAAHMLGIAAGERSEAWTLRAMEMAEASADPRAKGWLGPLYNNLAWTFFDRGRYDEALALQRKAEAWHLERDRRVPARIARWSIGRVMRAQGLAAEALALQEALLASAQDGDPVGYTYEELAECCLLLGDARAPGLFARAHEHLSQDAWLVRNEPARIARLAELAAG